MHVINTYYIVISITITITDSIFHITITIAMDFFQLLFLLLLHQNFCNITITITYYPMSGINSLTFFLHNKFYLRAKCKKAFWEEIQLQKIHARQGLT